jgi:bacterioferritin
MDTTTTPITELLNELLGAYWGAAAQHQTHVALIDSWGIVGLARNMQGRIADEPVTIGLLLDRLLDLGGHPDFAIGVPNIGRTLRSVLENDMEGQRKAAPALNAAAEAAGAAHDATTRVLLEGILAEEEQHFLWLQTELDLLDRLGEALYTSNRLTPPSSTAPAAG